MLGRVNYGIGCRRKATHHLSGWPGPIGHCDCAKVSFGATAVSFQVLLIILLCMCYGPQNILEPHAPAASITVQNQIKHRDSHWYPGDKC